MLIVNVTCRQGPVYSYVYGTGTELIRRAISTKIRGISY